MCLEAYTIRITQTDNPYISTEEITFWNSRTLLPNRKQPLHTKRTAIKKAVQPGTLERVSTRVVVVVVVVVAQPNCLPTLVRMPQA